MNDPGVRSTLVAFLIDLFIQGAATCASKESSFWSAYIASVANSAMGIRAEPVIFAVGDMRWTAHRYEPCVALEAKLAGVWSRLGPPQAITADEGGAVSATFAWGREVLGQVEERTAWRWAMAFSEVLRADTL